MNIIIVVGQPQLLGSNIQRGHLKVCIPFLY